MKIGILPALDPASGGIYQYSLTMLNALSKWKSGGCEDEFIVLVDSLDKPGASLLEEEGWIVKPMIKEPSLKRKAFDLLKPVFGEDLLLRSWHRSKSALSLDKSGTFQDAITFRPEINKWLKVNEIDLMLYPAPNPLSFETRIPYVMAIHDLQHRLQPEFPEVSANGEWESREYLFRNGSRYAALILADSEIGKEDILNFYGLYGVTPDKVKVLPFLPANYLSVEVPERERERVRTVYHLPSRYLFYPAQFWPHKNHKNIVKALGLLKERYDLIVPIMFCGSYSGELRTRTFQEVLSISRELGLCENVRYLGYVPDSDMSAIYAEADGLIMPTFFGPTNIPVLEAWAFGCPVITSNIRGIREQTGDAALLVDPSSVESIASSIYQIWIDEDVRCALISKGKQRLSNYTPDDYQQKFVEIVEEAKSLVISQRIKQIDTT
jgi:glycosyltransferase involved in cell wall biosynthesis